MTTDNRTNDPTEAQVEAAAKAAYEFDADVSELFGRGFTRDFDGMPQWAKDTHLDKARAALVAAQGAAPQAESAPKSRYISPSLPAMIRNLWKRDPSENSVRTALKLAGDLIQELIDLKAAPVLPSSGVDEERLAEVIRKLRFDDAGCWADGIDCTESVSDHADEIARAVAEWLKGQER